MQRLAIELIIIFLVCLGVFTAMWKFVLSKIPAVRVFLKLAKIEETDELAKQVGSIDMGRAKDHKKEVDNFTKEKF